MKTKPEYAGLDVFHIIGAGGGSEYHLTWMEEGRLEMFSVGDPDPEKSMDRLLRALRHGYQDELANAVEEAGLEIGDFP